jgi:hypothetical protein
VSQNLERNAWLDGVRDRLTEEQWKALSRSQRANSKHRTKATPRGGSDERQVRPRRHAKRGNKRVPAVNVPTERADGTPDYSWVYTDPDSGQAFKSKRAARNEWARLRHVIESGGDPSPTR